MNAFEIERVENGWVLREEHDGKFVGDIHCGCYAPGFTTVHVFAAADTLIARLTDRMKAREGS